MRSMICLLLLTVLGKVSSQAGIEQNGELGRFFQFEESIPVLDNVVIQWSFPNDTTAIAQKIPPNGPTCLGPYVGRCELFLNGTLRLDSLTNADQGTYYLYAQYTDFRPIKRTTYQLSVHPPLRAPILRSNPPDPDKIINGTEVTLYCDAGDQNVTSYTFRHGEKDLCREPHVTCQRANLTFRSITVGDEGSYTCTIQNPVTSNTSNPLQLAVSVPISNVTLTSNESKVIWPGFDSVSLTCSADGTNVSYSWSLRGKPLPENPRFKYTPNNSTLTISPVSADDNGNFTCTATNWINSSISNEFTLRLAASVSNVNLTSNTSASPLLVGEDSVSLHCSADGTDVQFSWNLKGETFPGNPHNNTLTLSPISRNDAGPFTCIASNRISNKTSNDVTFNLAWRPNGTIKCSADGDPKNVHLKCSWPGGQPAANVSLTFHNVTDTGNDIVTRDVSAEGNLKGSILTCHGEQLGNKSECTLPLELPEAVKHDNNAITEAQAGSTAVLQLTLVEGISATFAWKRVTPNPAPHRSTRATSVGYIVNSTNSSSSLQILNATKDDSGKYECTATNFVGSQTFVFTLNVTEKAPAKPTENTPPNPSGGLDGGAIAGIVIGVIAGVALIGILVFFLVRKR